MSILTHRDIISRLKDAPPLVEGYLDLGLQLQNNALT
jgi:hypothetical protein